MGGRGRHSNVELLPLKRQKMHTRQKLTAEKPTLPLSLSILCLNVSSSCGGDSTFLEKKLFHKSFSFSVNTFSHIRNVYRSFIWLYIKHF